MATTACFIIVSRNDIPIYEAEVGSATKREDAAQMHQFILHAALDIVQDLAWTTSAMYLKAIDRFNDLVVSVYVTAGHILCVSDFNCVSDKKNTEKMENDIYVIFFAFSVGVYFP
ncbi:trafficking protein particle complex subunit 2 isoform X2 [Populus alba x Populus x berolinensis]|nr:trafficking protein particle complex subunit 2 isoform X2 [Populus alba x Populus x berolinensis]